jgi:hypothetical protein
MNHLGSGVRICGPTGRAIAVAIEDRSKMLGRSIFPVLLN